MTNFSLAIKAVASLAVIAAFVAISSKKDASPGSKNRGRGLKGASRQLQFTFPGPPQFTGGVIVGTGGGGGSAGGVGSVTNTDDMGTSAANGSGMFASQGGSSGFINTSFGTATGVAAGGASGDQLGTATADMGIGTVSFNGATTASGGGDFGAGLSPVAFDTITTIIPGVLIPGSGGSKSGGSKSGGSSKSSLPSFTPPTSTTVIIPVPTGPTGGFAMGGGALNINSNSAGTIMTTMMGGGVGSSTGNAANNGGGQAMATNLLGTAGGIASGAGSGTASGGGNTMLDTVNGMFTGTGSSVGSFVNEASGIFGEPPSPFPIITFP